MKLVATTKILKDINERIAGLSCTDYTLSTTSQPYYPFQSGTTCSTKADYSTSCAAKHLASTRMCCCVVPGENAEGVCSIEPTPTTAWSGALAHGDCPPDDPGYPCIAGKLAGHTGVAVGGRYIYYFGGYTASQYSTYYEQKYITKFTPKNTLFVLDTQGGTSGFDPVWIDSATTGSAAPSARANHVAVLLGDTMYVHGGDAFAGNYIHNTQLQDLHRLDTTKKVWSGPLSVVGTAPGKRAGHTGVGVGGRYIYYFGGYTASRYNDYREGNYITKFTPKNTLFVLDTQGGTSGTALVWSTPPTSGDSPIARANHVAVRIAPSWVYVHGGDAMTGNYIHNAQLDDVHRVLANKCPTATYPISDTVCRGCSEGKWSAKAGADLQADSQCEGLCPKGKWSGVRGLTASGECPGRCSVGRYGNSKGLRADLDCTACPANTAGSSVGADSDGTCVACEEGKFSFEGAATCTSCGFSTCSVVTSATVACAGKCSIAGGSQQLSLVGTKLTRATTVTVGGSVCTDLQVAVDGTTATCTLPQSAGGSSRIFINGYDFTALPPVVYGCPTNSIPIGDACQLCSASTRAPFVVGTSACTQCSSNEMCPLGAMAAMHVDAVSCDASTSTPSSCVVSFLAALRARFPSLDRAIVLTHTVTTRALLSLPIYRERVPRYGCNNVVRTPHGTDGDYASILVVFFVIAGTITTVVSVVVSTVVVVLVLVRSKYRHFISLFDMFAQEHFIPNGAVVRKNGNVAGGLMSIIFAASLINFVVYALTSYVKDNIVVTKVPTTINIPLQHPDLAYFDFDGTMVMRGSFGANSKTVSSVSGVVQRNPVGGGVVEVIKANATVRELRWQCSACRFDGSVIAVDTRFATKHEFLYSIKWTLSANSFTLGARTSASGYAEVPHGQIISRRLQGAHSLCGATKTADPTLPAITIRTKVRLTPRPPIPTSLPSPRTASLILCIAPHRARIRFA